MVMSFKEVARQCIGPCNQNAVVSIDGKYVSLSGLIQTAQSLARETRTDEFTKLLSRIVNLMHALTDIAKIQGVTVTKSEMNVIKDAIKNYKGHCDLYFLIDRKDATVSDLMLSRSELEQLYRKKASAATTVEQKSHYSAVMNDVAMLYNQLQDVSDALIAARVALLRIEKPVTQEEKTRRGYGLSVEQRVQKNVEFLRGKFKDLPGEDIGMEMTVGRYYSVPGMYQWHRVFAIDTLTGIVFWPGEIERFAAFIGAKYEQRERDATTLDYVFAVPMPNKPQVITLPAGYRVFPLQLAFDKKELSAEAQEVIKHTQIDLFVPVIADLEKTRKRTMDPELLRRLLDVRRHLGY